MAIQRQARAEATRQSIIRAAVELFGEVGYGDTDMTDVVARAKTSGGTCYYYFPTKSSLAAAVIEQANAGIAAEMAPIWASDEPAMLDLITATFRFIAITENDPVVRVGYQLRQAVRQISEAGATSFADTEVVFATCIRGGIRDGHIRADVTAKEPAYTLFAALVGCRLLSDARSEDPFARMAQVWRTVLQSIATDEGLPVLMRRVRAESRKRT